MSPLSSLTALSPSLSPPTSSASSVDGAHSATTFPTSAYPISIDPDLFWGEGHVLSSKDCGPWPSGMYACDMAKGFHLMTLGSKRVPERFKHIFGRQFHRSAWYRERRIWNESSEAERKKAKDLPRCAEGLWSAWKQG
ncbi:hypothetical protein R3P38DRAFT_2575056 [Favolaschia claudopus]|uniref:Uncharacterized protein n=1 Tax=Favolaschia claudopus TaxID=2862362 RepID=A0AAV9ZLK1_9AGAR